MKTRHVAAAFAPALLLSACATMPAVSPGVQIDPDTRPACAANCAKMGLELAAVVLVRNSAGCVCTVPGAKPSSGAGAPEAGASVAVAGGVLIADEDDQQSQAASAQPWQGAQPATVAR